MKRFQVEIHEISKKCYFDWTREPVGQNKQINRLVNHLTSKLSSTSSDITSYVQVSVISE